jgi:hypothetical protein
MNKPIKTSETLLFMKLLLAPPLLTFAKATIFMCVTNSFSSQSVGDSSYMASITKHLQIAAREREIPWPRSTVNTAHTFVWRNGNSSLEQ